MKKLVSRYPVNAAGNDIDREKLYELKPSAKYPRFLSNLVFYALPLPVIADAARISVDVLIDAALGNDELNPLEEYCVCCAIGLLWLDPLYDAVCHEEDDYPVENIGSADWNDYLEELERIKQKFPLSLHPAWPIFARYLDKPAKMIPAEVSSGIMAWLDFAERSKYMHKRIRRAPLKKRKSSGNLPPAA